MENISKNAEANTVSTVHQLDPTKYVRITEKPVDRLDRRLGHGGKL